MPKPTRYWIRPSPPVELVQLKPQFDVDETEKSQPDRVVVFVMTQLVFDCSTVVVFVKNVVIPNTGWAAIRQDIKSERAIKKRGNCFMLFKFNN